jgi:hypothetical protein
MNILYAAPAAPFWRPCRSSGGWSNVTSCHRERRLAAADGQAVPTPRRRHEGPVRSSDKPPPLVVSLNTQQIGGVYRDQNTAPVVAFKNFAADFRDRHASAKDAARGRGAESDDDGGLDDRAFLIEPPAAAVDFIGVGALVKPAFAALHEFEMFHRVGDEDADAIEPGVCDCPIEHTAGGADKGQTAYVFGVAGLLSYKHQTRIGRPFARHHLCRVKIAFSAFLDEWSARA